ncbi:hypothetical protein GCM10008107_04840 [Psychrosphaera saromensis]|uniref:Uncharacterized protein n=1 Tax=Psychrosphaera saromensis TaxID=716813 RepID=A0A2S7UXT0_9GAMM|nr:hypothetical protein [Psychrosphaera saromensis]PQJ54579.1 hypothetical protein BTO11_13605 [Psychrosphaera saromensis]GHB58812.1 hypothetical protein GCM10008107_04840 [Psychrosphaera saromensis]GLQ14205.1 hypothetical protein GCM10007917_16600 [Psychrosphaera saromensis]
MASMAIGGATSGYSIVASVGTKLATSSKVFNGGLNAISSASESMIHDGLDGNNADLGKAFKSAVTSVPGLGNGSTLKGMMGSNIKDSMIGKGANEGVAELTYSGAKAAVGNVVKEIEKAVENE